jgi:RNA polymerase sigma-70 factor (ECF subfamily)
MDLHLQVFKRVAENDVQAYEMLFKEYYHFLCSFAYGHVKERHTAEEVVEEFFVDFWKNRHKLVITTSVRAYFITAIHNRCLNYLQREKSKFVSAHDISYLIDNEGSVGDKLISIEAPSLLTKELESILKKAIDNLPPNCKKIFLLSRLEDLSYDKISAKLNISVNTVKTQMKIALSRLRDDLKDYLPVILLYIII